MKIALAQLDLLIADLDGAAAAIRAAAATAVTQGADLIVFPELVAVGGYAPRDLLERRWFVERQWALLHEVARDLPLPAIVGAAEPLDPARLPANANVAAVLAGGTVQAIYRKRLLPTYDVFDEERYFRPGDGPLVVTLAGRRIGITVCEDIWNNTRGEDDRSGARYAVDPVADLAGRCDLVVNLSASPWHLGKPTVRRRVTAAAAARAGCPLVYVNQVGAHDELLFDGDSGIALPDGRWLPATPRWQAGVTTIVLPDDRTTGRPDDRTSPPCDEAELHAALVLGIRDYCAKTRQTKVVLGLSGGIDSALVAALAVDALGADAVTGLLMPGPYSSVGSITDAEALATALGVRTHTLRISEAVAAVTRELAPVFAGNPVGVAEENLQSRMRGVLVMATANQLGAMALTTGNKSELATGYCTIYGDMNGGLAPLGDLYKTQVWALSRWMNAAAGRERIPTASIDKAPSAELRPDQTDQDSLPPYDVLDRILKAYLEDTVPPEVIAQTEDPAVVAKVIRLTELNEFKRRQGAPVLRVSPKAFGTGRRIPIARRF